MFDQNRSTTDQDYYRRLLDSLPDQVLVIDSQHRIVDANTAYLSAIEKQRDEVIGEYCYQLTYPGANVCDHSSSQTCPVLAVWETGSPASKLCLLQDESGKKRYVEVTASPLLDGNGRIQAVIETRRDITAKRQLESTLAAIHDLGQELVHTRDESEIARAVVQAMNQILHFETCSVSLVQGDWLVAVASSGYAEPNSTVNISMLGDMGITAAVVKSGKLLNIPDISQDPRYVARGGFLAKSELAVPLTIGDQILGVLNIESGQLDAFDETDLQRLTTLGDMAAVALESARAHRAEQSRLAQMSALYQLGLTLITEQDPTAIAKQIVAEMGKFLGTETATICLLDEDGDHLITHGVDRGGTISPSSLPIDGESFSAIVARTGRPISANDTDGEEWLAKGTLVGDSCRAWLGVPLRLENRIFGVIGVQTYADHTFGPAEEQLLTQIAAQVAPVLENAQLYEQTKLRMSEMETLFAVTASISSDLSLDHILPLVAQELGKAIDAASCIISRWDETARILVLTAEYIHPDHQGVDHFPEDFGAALRLKDYTVVETALLTRQPFAICADDPACTPDELAVLDEVKWGSLLALPMIVSGQVIGLVELYDAPASREFTTREIRLAQTLANQAAIAINHAQLFNETKRRLLREKQLNRLVDTMGSEMNLDALIPHLLPLMAELTGADAATITIRNPAGQRGELVFFHNLPASLVNSQEASPRGVSLDMHDQRRTIILDDYRTHPHALPGWVEARVRSTLGIPLLVEGQAVGSLGLFSLGEIRPFDLEAVSAGEAVAQLAAVAIQRARLFQAERQQRQKAEALREASLALGATLDLDQVLSTLLDRIHDVIPYDAANILWIEGEIVRVTHQRGYEKMGTAEQTASVQLHVEETISLCRMIDTRQPLIIADPHCDPDWIDFESTPWIRSWAGAPIIICDQVVGFFSLDSGTRNFYQPEHTDLLAAFANQAAMAVENAKLYQAEQNRRNQTVALNHLTRRLNRGLTFDQLFKSFAADLKALVDFDRASIALATDPDHPAETEFVMHTIFDRPGAPLSEGVTLPLAATAAHEDISAGRAHLTPNLADELDYPAEQFLFQGGLRSRVNLPLIIRQQTIGTLNLASRKTNAFGQEQLPLLQQVADAVVVAVDNAQLYQAVQEHALQLEDKVDQRTAELQAERDRTQAILDSAAEGMVVADNKGIIQYINPAMEQLSGFTLEEARGQTTNLWTSGQHSREFYKEMWDIVLTGQIWEGEIINRRKDGSFYDALVTIAPIAHPGGKPSGFVGLQQDISERKELERMKDRFVSNVSHELRTPLTNLKLYLKLLEKGKPQKRAQYLATLHREANRLQQLIEDLLSFSRLNVGYSQANRKIVDLNKLVGQLVEDRMALATERGLTLQAELAHDLPPVMADEKMLGQVISNLMSNSMNYNSAGGRIVARTDIQEKDQVLWITASVIDTGFGISAEDQKHLFERFYRGEAAKRARSAGTGLGLAICQEFINQHYGLITVESELGKGSNFTVWLPPTEQ